MQVRKIMRRAHIVDRDISFGEAAKVMSAGHIGALIIVLKKKVAGIVTDSDILRQFGKEGNIFEIMNKNVEVIESKEDINVALDLMKKKKIRHLPVVDKGHLVGIIAMENVAAHADELGGDFFV